MRQNTEQRFFRDLPGCTLPVARIGAPTIGFTFYDCEEPLMGMIRSECV